MRFDGDLPNYSVMWIIITIINHLWLGMVYTNYLWWWLGDGLWHGYTRIGLILDIFAVSTGISETHCFSSCSVWMFAVRMHLLVGGWLVGRSGGIPKPSILDVFFFATNANIQHNQHRITVYGIPETDNVFFWFCDTTYQKTCPQKPPGRVMVTIHRG